MRTSSSRARRGLLALCSAALILSAALPAGADETPAPDPTVVEPTPDPTTAPPSTAPAPPPPTSSPAPEPPPTTPPPTSDPTTAPPAPVPSPTTAPPASPTTPPPPPPSPTTPPSPVSSPSPTVVPPTASPTTAAPTTTAPTTAAPTPSSTPTPLASPTTAGTTAFTTTLDTGLLAPTTATTLPARTTAITTGGAALMSALIRINAAEARCAANAPTETAPMIIDSAVMPAAVGAFHDDQVVNAAVVIGVGLELGLPERAIAIAVMTAMAESGLRPGTGEAEPVGPGGVGLFEQGPGGSWGTWEERIDPATSARNFYTRLTAVPGWDTLDPAVAADAVQRAEEPGIYAPYWEAALQMVSELTTRQVVSTSPRPCVTDLGTLSTRQAVWSNPVRGRITSAFGYRVHPVLGVTAEHWGTDIAASCGTPIVAAGDGIVVWSGGGLQGRTGNQIVVYHGNGVLTRYGHVLSGSVTVSVGAAVTSGQRIASVGGDPGLDPAGAGLSTGCHLHFETNTDNGGTVIDPVSYLAGYGVKLGTS